MEAANIEHIDARASQGFINNPIGATIHQQFGLNAEQVANLIRRIVETMGVAPQFAQGAIAVARANVYDLRRRVAVLVEYKEVHDLLQQLEVSHRVLYTAVFEQDEPLVAEQIQWRKLAASRVSMQTALLKLCDYVEITSFAADADWNVDLRQASTEVQEACEQRNAGRLADALDVIDQVIGRETSRFNDRLIGAVDALRMTEWVHTLEQISREMPTWPGMNEGPANRFESFAGDVNQLSALAQTLQALRNQHDEWQQVDNVLRSEQPQVVRNVGRFKQRWQRSLGQRVRGLSSDTEADWARHLLVKTSALETSLAKAVAADIADAFYECRSIVSTRFTQIDFQLRGLCRILMEASIPIGTLLEQFS